MLPSNERLSRTQFNQTLTKGLISIYNHLGTLKYTKSLNRKISVVTSSKHEKKAVNRNKLRRRIYNLFKENKTIINGIFYTSKSSYTLTYTEIKSLFYELIQKINK